jgi:hypothetical protein
MVDQAAICLPRIHGIVLPQLEMEKAFKNTVGWSPDCPLAPAVTQI